MGKFTPPPWLCRIFYPRRRQNFSVKIFCAMPFNGPRCAKNSERAKMISALVKNRWTQKMAILGHFGPFLTFRRDLRVQKIKNFKIALCYGIPLGTLYTVAGMDFWFFDFLGARKTSEGQIFGWPQTHSTLNKLLGPLGALSWAAPKRCRLRPPGASGILEF